MAPELPFGACGLSRFIFIGRNLNRQAAIVAQRAIRRTEDAAMIACPLQRRIGKDDGIVAVGFKVSKIGKFELEPLAKFRSERLAQLQGAFDHRRRRVNSDDIAFRAAASEFERVLSGSATQIDNSLARPKLQVPEHHRYGFTAVFAETIIKFRIPVRHAVQLSWGLLRQPY